MHCSSWSLLSLFIVMVHCSLLMLSLCIVIALQSLCIVTFLVFIVAIVLLLFALCIVIVDQCALLLWSFVYQALVPTRASYRAARAGCLAARAWCRAARAGCRAARAGWQAARAGDKLALLPSVKRQTFCVGDGFKMDKHKAWNNKSVVAHKSVGSMTTKGQMKPTLRVSLTASQAGENSQSNFPEHTIVSSILKGLTFRRNHGRRAAYRDISRFFPRIDRIFPGEALNPIFGTQDEGFSEFRSR